MNLGSILKNPIIKAGAEKVIRKMIVNNECSGLLITLENDEIKVYAQMHTPEQYEALQKEHEKLQQSYNHLLKAL